MTNFVHSNPGVPAWVASARSSATRTGFTLLEVVLALSMTVVVMAAIGVAIHLHLRAGDKTRVGIERDQLARTLMRRIADDIRAAVRREPFDDAGLQALMESAKGAAKGLAQGASQQSTSSAGGGGAGRAGSAGTASAAGTAGTAGTATTIGESAEDTTEQTTQTTGSPSLAPGLFGNEFELQVDVGRIPRADEFTGAMVSGAPFPSDVKTVYYFLANSATGLSGVNGTGLMRSEMNRATALWANETGDVDIFAQAAESLAEEVVGIRFSYFDGYEWLLEWDSEVAMGLPLAVEIELVLAGDEEQEQTALGSAYETGLSGVDPELVYRTVVQLPNGQIPQATSASGDSSSSSDGSSSAGSSGKSGASGGGAGSSSGGGASGKGGAK
jgi:uncharacterized membrane protein YgcG